MEIVPLQADNRKSLYEMPLLTALPVGKGIDLLTAKEGIRLN